MTINENLSDIIEDTDDDESPMKKGSARNVNFAIMPHLPSPPRDKRQKIVPADRRNTQQTLSLAGLVKNTPLPARRAPARKGNSTRVLTQKEIKEEMDEQKLEEILSEYEPEKSVA